MLVKWVSEQTARRGGYRNGCQSFLDLAPRKDIWGKGYFYLWKIFYFKRKCTCSTTPIINKYWLFLGKGTCITQVMESIRMYSKHEGIQSTFTTCCLIVLLRAITSQCQYLTLRRTGCMACAMHVLTGCCMLEYVASIPGISIVPYLENVCTVQAYAALTLVGGGLHVLHVCCVVCSVCRGSFKG